MHAKQKITLGISSCLLGNNTRYDGGNKFDQFLLDTFGPVVEWVPICPEVEAGLTIPREPMQLVRDSGKLRLVTIETKKNQTAALNRWTKRKLQSLEQSDLCGFVLKARSPSCGVHDTERFSASGENIGKGSGLFATAVMKSFPAMPVEDEERLREPARREKFLERAADYQRRGAFKDVPAAMQDEAGRKSMKAVVFNKYGGNEVIGIWDMPVPACGPGEVLVKVHAASINPVDWKMRSGMLRIFTGGKFPKILGRECSGEVIDIGSGVSSCKNGEAVIALPAIKTMGAFAEFVAVPERTAYPKAPEISFEEAACVPIAGLTALQALRDKGQVAYGKKVLVNGASGGVGHFAVQIAKLFGAEVTAVCSTANAALVRGLGADRVIDYTGQDFTREDYRYDIIFDAVAKRTFGECKKVLSANGVYVSTLPSFDLLLNRYVTGYFTGRKAQVIMVRMNAGDMAWMQDRIVSGRIKIVIDKTYSLDRANEALAYSETGRVRGKIALKISS